MDRALVVFLAVVVGAVLTLGVVAAVRTFDGDDSASIETSFPPVEHDGDAAVDLIEAWSRWRTSSFVASGTWTRTLDGVDAPLTGEVYLAQDPPRRYVVRLGSVVARTTDQEAFENEVVTELALVGGYVTGDGRLYDVAEGDEPGCWRAELVVPALASPWGRWAEYCFDDETGALTKARVRRQSAIDIEINTDVRAEVSDADFG